MIHRKACDVEEFVTKDGSRVRELIHPSSVPAERLSLALAVVGAGESTRRHLHRRSEEIYYVLGGRGVVHVGGEKAEVEAGDAVLIPPGTPHFAVNTGEEELVILCACSPAYSHEDTELL